MPDIQEKTNHNTYKSTATVSKAFQTHPKQQHNNTTKKHAKANVICFAKQVSKQMKARRNTPHHTTPHHTTHSTQHTAPSTQHTIQLKSADSNATQHNTA